MKAVLVVVALGLAAPAHAGPKHEKHRTTRLLALSGGAFAYATSELLIKDSLAPDACRWCTPPSFDASVRNHLVWHDFELAAKLSTFIGYVGVPLVTGALFVFATPAITDDRAVQLVDDAIPIAEAVVYTQLATQVVKFSVGRQRPFRHFGQDVPVGNEDNLSFFSGHSSLCFSIAVSAGLVAHHRHYKAEPYIWAAGLGLSAVTAYLRIAADRHYLSDVLAGSAAGAVGGYVFPRLSGSLPGRGTTVVPTGNGLAIAGRF